MNNQIVFIGVNYKTQNETLRWVKSINRTNPNAMVVVSDNSYEDNPHLKIELENNTSNNVFYYDTGANLGYFNGAAFAFHKLGFIPEWTVVSNVDLELETNNVYEVLEKYSDAGVVAPAIISVDTGFDKNPYRIERPSKKTVSIKKTAFSNSFYSTIYSIASEIRSKLIRKQRIKGPKIEEGQDIYLPYGASFIFSKRYFEKGCKIDYPLFLFGEELYVAEQCREADLDITYVPSIVFKNYEHASTSLLASETVRKRNFEAMSFVLDRFYTKNC